MEVQGKDRLVQFLIKFPPQVNKEVDARLAGWARYLHSYLKTNHPWRNRTGRLKRSHRWEKKAPLWYEISADPRREGAAKNYGMFLEYGTRTMPPYPWFRPAYYKFAKVIAQDIKQAVIKAGRASK